MADKRVRKVVAQEIKREFGEDVFEMILNFYIDSEAEKKYALDLWQDFWKKRGIE